MVTPIKICQEGLINESTKRTITLKRVAGYTPGNPSRYNKTMNPAKTKATPVSLEIKTKMI